MAQAGKSVKEYGRFAKSAAKQWSQDRCSTLAAAIAFYSIFSLAPLLLIAVFIAGIVFGEQAAQQQIVSRIESIAGPQAAQLLGNAIENAHQSPSASWAFAAGIAALLFGAMGIFVQAQMALNRVFNAERRTGLVSIIIKRIYSFCLALALGLLALAWMILGAILSSLRDYLPGILPGAPILWQILYMLLSLGIATLFIAAIFKILPDVAIAWQHVWAGAIVTAVLLAIGQFFISLYMARASLASTYGAAGSLVIVLLWLYYSAMIFLFGAEFTQVYITARQPSS